MYLDPASKDVIEAIRVAGYAVSLRYDNVTFVAAAKDDAGQTWTVHGRDVYRVLCELAEKIGIDLGDA